MNKTGSFSQHLLPVPKWGFDPLHEGVAKCGGPETFSFIISMPFLWTASRDCGCHSKNSIPATEVEKKHRSSSSLLASVARSRIVAPQARESPLSS
jgi:hypothetical protein